MNVGLILRNYDHLVKRLAFPTTSFLDEGTLGEQGDNEERGRNRILIERDRHGASVPRAVLRFLRTVPSVDSASQTISMEPATIVAPRILSGHYSTSSICSSRRRRSTPPSRRVLLGPHSSRRPIGSSGRRLPADLRPRYKARRTADRQMALAPRSSSSHL